MSGRLFYHPLAELELNEAALYYERESRGLGLAFLAAAQRCTDAIAAHPDAGTLLNGNIRRRLVTSFPYGILYRSTAEGIRILAVMNLKRRPFYWAGRQ